MAEAWKAVARAGGQRAQAHNKVGEEIGGWCDLWCAGSDPAGWGGGPAAADLGAGALPRGTGSAPSTFY